MHQCWVKYFAKIIFGKICKSCHEFASIYSDFLHLWLLPNLVTIGKLVLTPLLNNVRLSLRQPLCIWDKLDN